VRLRHPARQLTYINSRGLPFPSFFALTPAAATGFVGGPKQVAPV
jgi:hypothetical protein